MATSRRALLQNGMTGAGVLTVLGSGLFRAQALAEIQRATLSTLVFLSKRLDASTADYRKWYIEHHAPDFLSFGRPYLKRYAQNFVDKAYMGEVDFDCISEFQYLDEPSREALLKLNASPEAEKILAEHPKIGSQPGPNEDHGGSRTFTAREQVLAGRPRGYDEAGARKQAILIRRQKAATAGDFADAVQLYSAHIGQGAERVAFDLSLPEENRPLPLFDAVIQIWPAKGAGPVTSLGTVPDGVEVANIIDLVSYEANLGAL